MNERLKSNSEASLAMFLSTFDSRNWFMGSHDFGKRPESKDKYSLFLSFPLHPPSTSDFQKPDVQIDDMRSEQDPRLARLGSMVFSTSASDLEKARLPGRCSEKPPD
jgi:hypothetical protein